MKWTQTVALIGGPLHGTRELDVDLCSRDRIELPVLAPEVTFDEMPALMRLQPYARVAVYRRHREVPLVFYYDAS